MTPRRALLIAAAALPLLVHIACSTGDALDPIPSEQRDAGEIDAGRAPRPTNDAGDEEEEDGGPSPKKDSGTNPIKDSGTTPGDDSGGTPPVVIINEIRVDNDLSGDTVEFVELKGPPGAKLDDLQLRILDSTGQPDHTVIVGEPGGVFPPSGYWVIGTIAVQNVDRVVSLGQWGLDNDRGAAQLVRNITTVVDVVGWSSEPDAGALPTPGSGPTATGEGSPALIPSIAKRSFGRQSFGDTNDNAVDFCSTTPSPGTSNAACD